ncbi:protein phosphatase 1L-like [Bradysia coprophila]|uniref:protein phosphatase 1L-like n=1 Tax=Bradysia coprophila TaxID=38358 RepID=UPI00187DCD58|nr:protein phosphatase 1L-like [Bradysia coprophila]
MDDQLEDKIFSQVYINSMKILSKFAVTIPPLSSWGLFRFYLCAIVLFIVLFYLQAAVVWPRGLLHRITTSFGYTRKMNRLQIMTTNSPEKKQSWEQTRDASSVFAVQGRRLKMEDRFVLEENVNNTGVSFFAIFDGHGGEFAADYAKDFLVQNLLSKITAASNSLRGIVTPSQSTKTDCPDDDKENTSNQPKPSSTLTQRRPSIRKSLTDDCVSNGNCNREQELYLNKLGSSIRNKESFLNNNNNNNNVKPQTFDGKCYVENGKINFGKMLTDEVLAADFELVKTAKKTSNLAGTTALIAIVDDSRLIVANVGDSRGVMCDAKMNAIPLSFDHKPNQSREKNRIKEAGGFIAFHGVWRVAGILATSRALGDYPLKDKKFVIADPDILSFDLSYNKPKFLILASDGLWDTFSNEEAVAFIKDRLHEPNFGAKSLVLESYYRGSVDNITVLVIVFKDGKYTVGSSVAS